MSMAQSGGGELPANRATGTSDDDDGEDHLSALPDDVLVLILLRLSTKAAARTSVLSRRWHPVWTLLPALIFPAVHCLHSALSASEVSLRNLVVFDSHASPQSLTASLPLAACRVAGQLFLCVSMDGEAEAELSQRDTFELPCFDKATSISLLGPVGLSMPPAGVFARLTKLTLNCVRFHGPGELGDAVSSPRCPLLQKLSIRDVWGLDGITIHSKSPQLLYLQNLRGVRQVTVVAPSLKDLTLFHCFSRDQNQPVVNISVPQLKLLEWMDEYDPSSVHLGSMEHLQTLSTFFDVYGLDDSPHNRACLMLLPQFKAIENLVLSLMYQPEIDTLEYLMEDMTILPVITSLRLTVTAKGHTFGASLFHVLRICSGIKRLTLVLSAAFNVENSSVCSSDCICDEPTNWKVEDISFNRLQELEIQFLGASEHDILFVKRLLNWVPVLKVMTVTFTSSITASKGKELFQMFRGFSRPGVCMKLYIYQEFSKVLLAPED